MPYPMDFKPPDDSVYWIMIIGVLSWIAWAYALSALKEPEPYEDYRKHLVDYERQMHEESLTINLKEMSKNPGKIFEITDGKFKGKFAISRNADQMNAMQTKLYVKVCEDSLCTVICKKDNGNDLTTLIEADNLKLIGYVD